MHQLVRGLAVAVATLALFTAALPTLAAEGTAPPSPTPRVVERPNGWCEASGDMQRIELHNCRLAGDGSVKVFWSDPELLDDVTADAVIASTKEAMGRYETVGFTAADISGLNRVDIAVLPGDDTPLYSWKLGTISIGDIAAKRIATGELGARMDLWHELFHWIQDENYVMGWARLSGDLSWWLETTAELGTFLIEPEATSYNASLYGQSSLNDNRTLVYTLSPHQWVTNEQYLHAQRLWSAMCPSGCALSQSGFVAAVNAGTYPFDDEATKTALRDGIERYAKYTLTGELDGAAPVAALASGARTGDFLVIKGSDTGPWELDTNSYPPQIDRKAGTIAATLQPDSIYPLLVVSGPDAEASVGLAHPAGDPAMLVIEPGIEFWYTLDGGKVQHHDGGSELRLGPVHSDYALGKVRLVAIARDQAATFRAKLEPVSLEGDWIFEIDGKVKVASSTCGSEAKQMVAGKQDILDLLTRFASTKGSYAAASADDPGDLAWVQEKPFKFSAKEPAAVYEADLDVGAKGVTGSLSVATAGHGRSAGVPPGLMLALVPLALLPFMRRRHLAVGLPLLLAFVLVGCVAGVAIDAQIDADMRFDRLEYLGAGSKSKAKASDPKGKAAKGVKPRWRVSGGTAEITIELEATVAGAGKQAGGQTKKCSMVLKAAVSGELYPDGVVKMPKF